MICVLKFSKVKDKIVLMNLTGERKIHNHRVEEDERVFVVRQRHEWIMEDGPHYRKRKKPIQQIEQKYNIRKQSQKGLLGET